MHYKFGIYGEPATGKSVFALHFPKPFFITTDSNYEFLYDFGAKEEDHYQVTSWSDFKKLIKDFDFSSYETIVVDVLEDLYLWAETEYCAKNRIEDISDIGYGKGYKIVRTDFAVEIFKLLAMDKNVIILTHCDETQGKTARGGDFTAYEPSKIIPEKVWTMINGRLRFFFRTHLEDVTDGDTIITKRMLSITPKPHELQINRGTNVDKCPSDIELDFKAFCDTLNLKLDNSKSTKKVTTPKATEASKPVETPKAVTIKPTPKVVAKTETPKVEDVIEDDELPFDMGGIDLNAVKEETKAVEVAKPVEAPKATPAPTKKVESAEDKLALLRAKILANKK